MEWPLPMVAAVEAEEVAVAGAKEDMALVVTVITGVAGPVAVQAPAAAGALETVPAAQVQVTALATVEIVAAMVETGEVMVLTGEATVETVAARGVKEEAFQMVL